MVYIAISVDGMKPVNCLNSSLSRLSEI